jgi:hypothetical protein
MIVEKRTYTLYPGKVAEYMKHYKAEGLAVQTRILPRMVGWFYSDIGELNQIVHMWAYDDLNERARKRKELGEDPGWQAYVAKIRPLLLRQESQILMPAEWSPIR